MRTYIDRLKPNNKKILLFATIVIAVGFLVWFKLFPQETNLTINSSPVGSSIFIDEKYIGNDQFTGSLPKGNHTIKVTKDGYQTEVKQINLSSKLVLNISLSILPAKILEDIKPNSISTVTFASPNSIISINRITGHLVRISPGKTETIYSSPVKKFTYNHPFITILERTKPEQITIINLENNQTQTQKLNQYQPIISAAAESALSLYFLGKHNPADRNATLFLSSLDETKPQNIITTNATDIYPIISPYIVLFAYADAQDASTVSILNTSTGQNLMSVNANTYKISPNKDKVATLASKNLYILDPKNNSPKSVSVTGSSKIFWKNNLSLGIIKNLFPGASISYLNPLTLKQTMTKAIDSLENIVIRKVLGSVDNFLFIENAQGNILQVPLPQ